MLKTHLNSLPYPKFILIEDCVTAKGAELLEYLLKNHEKRTEYATHYYVFQPYFNRAKEKRLCHDFTSDINNWLSQGNDFQKTTMDLKDSCVIVIDSLAHVIYKHGVSETYRILHDLKNKPSVIQIVGVLHTDLLEDQERTVQNFRHLATLHLELGVKRVSYTFKKGARKIIKQMEEYHFENGRFITEAIKKPDTEVIQQAMIQPEVMSTFKISLSEKDKESRSSLVLPYLPKETPDSGGGGGKIHYAFDAVDDWDEEDPDDDLDI